MPPSRPGFSRDFYLYLASRFCAATAMTSLRAVIAWQIFALSHSAFALGLVGLVAFPAMGLSLLGGALADTYDRKRIMTVAQSVLLTGALGLSLATLRGLVTLPMLYLVILLVAASFAFDSPARAALLPTLVPAERFPRAVTLATTNQALAFMTGPALAGFVIAAADVGAAYLMVALLITGSLAALALLTPPPPPRGLGEVSFAAIREGLAFVRRNEVILGCMMLDMFAVIFGGANALLPIYANDILHVGARGYGLLTSSLELGALLASSILVFLPPIRRAGRALLVTVALYGLATIVFGLSRCFPLSLAAYMAAGVADQVSVVLRSTAIQLSTPDALRGRVSSVNMIFIGASNQLGAVESGFVAALTNATFAVVSGGFGCLIVVALVASRLDGLRRYRIDPKNCY